MNAKATDTFTIRINGLSSDYAYLEISWEILLCSLKYLLKKGNQNVEKALAGPSR
jgi:hypothetical protein